MLLRFVPVLAAFLLLALPARADGIRVVASFSVLADLVRQVAGEDAAVTALIGPDGDSHGFAPSPADAARLADAHVIVVNGLGFEGWMDRLVRASGTKAAVVVASAGVRPLAADGHGHGGGAPDPHAWQDVANAKLFVANIRDALAAADPAGRERYRARAAAYGAELDALDRAFRDGIAALPPANRTVISSHDAFGYLGRAYGLRFVAPRGVSTESEASARDVARIVRQVRAEKIRAVFLENVTDPRLIETIAREGGARIGGRLYSDALSGPDGPAPTYLDMMRHNLRTLLGALAP